MIQRLVIDSNMLQTQVLRDYLSSSLRNLAILPDFVWLEMYKQQSATALLSRFSVIGEFSEQIKLLKPNGLLALLDPHHPDLISRMLEADAVENFRLMNDALISANEGHTEALTQLSSRWSNATIIMNGMLEGAADIAQSLPEIAEIFTPAEIRRCRVGEHYTPDMQAKIYGGADQIYEALLATYNVGPPHWSPTHRFNAYFYRYALAIMIYTLRWIATGSQVPKRLDRIRNDLIDLGFAVYGTYFAGLLTDDLKARWMHDNLSAALNNVGERMGIELCGIGERMA